MPLDKVKLANKRYKREQKRRQRRSSISRETPLMAHKRRLRNNKNHHRKMNGINKRGYIGEDEV